MRQHSTSDKQVRYTVTHSTGIKNTTFKEFLSHSDTKQGLSGYISQKYSKVLRNINIRYSITFDISRALQKFQVLIQTFSHNHEEEDTLHIIHATDAVNQTSECIIYSSDTDVFLISLHYYSHSSSHNILELCNSFVQVYSSQIK